MLRMVPQPPASAGGGSRWHPQHEVPSREAGEGDPPKAVEGAGPERGAWARPLHHASHGPPPPSRATGEDRPETGFAAAADAVPSRLGLSSSAGRLLLACASKAVQWAPSPSDGSTTPSSRPSSAGPRRPGARWRRRRAEPFRGSMARPSGRGCGRKRSHTSATSMRAGFFRKAGVDSVDIVREMRHKRERQLAEAIEGRRGADR